MSTTTLTSIRDWLRREDGESSFLVLLLVPVIVLVGFGLSVDWAGKVRAVSYTHLTLPTKRIV